MTNYAHGHDAEKVAADYLAQQGYNVVALNWRCPRAEIDIIARKSGEPVRCVEVKYRQSTTQGSGLDYITPSKIRQMEFAAKLWANQVHYTGEYTLAAIELSGPDYEITEFIEELW
jgi:putative endonuclease